MHGFDVVVQAWLWAVLVCCIFWVPLGSFEQQAVPREDPLCSFVTEENLPGGSCGSCCCDVTGTLPRPRRVPVAVGTEPSVSRAALGARWLPEDPPARGILSSQPSPCRVSFCACRGTVCHVCSTAKMIQQAVAAVCTLYSVAYSGYFLAHLARKSSFSLGAASVPSGLLCAFCSPTGTELPL